MSQITLKGFTDCEHCIYGRDLGARDYGCTNKERRKLWELDQKQFKMVNKGSHTCKYAERRDNE